MIISFLMAMGLTLTDLECLPVVIQSVQSPFRTTFVFTVCVFSKGETQGGYGGSDNPKILETPIGKEIRLQGNCFHDLAN